MILPALALQAPCNLFSWYHYIAMDTITSSDTLRLRLRAGTVKRIHVDKHVIVRNAKQGRTDPPITIQTSNGPYKSHSVDILGPSRVIYSPQKPLKCGAKVYTETRAEVVITT